MSHRLVSLAVLAGTAVLFSACKQVDVKPEEQPALLSGYTCCNFRYDKDWINDGNYAQLPMIPAGSPIKVTSYGRYRAHVDIDGKPFRLGLDYGRDRETTEQWVARLVVKDDPKAKLATYPPLVRKAIQNGQVMVGMTREQVIMSLGHPLTNENPRLDAPLWRYWWSSFGEYQVRWSTSGHVSGVTGHADTVALMLAPGNAAPALQPQVPAQAAPAAPAATTTSKTGKKQGGKTSAKPSPSSTGN